MEAVTGAAERPGHWALAEEANFVAATLSVATSYSVVRTLIEAWPAAVSIWSVPTLPPPKPRAAAQFGRADDSPKLAVERWRAVEVGKAR